MLGSTTIGKATIINGKGLTENALAMLLGQIETFDVIRSDTSTPHQWEEVNMETTRIDSIKQSFVKGSMFRMNSPKTVDKSLSLRISEYLANKGEVRVYMWGEDGVVLYDKSGKAHVLSKENVVPQYRVMYDKQAEADGVENGILAPKDRHGYQSPYYVYKPDCDPRFIADAVPFNKDGWFHEYDYEKDIHRVYCLPKTYTKLFEDWSKVGIVANPKYAVDFKLLIDALSYYFRDGFLALQTVQAITTGKVGMVDKWRYECIKHYHGHSMIFDNLISDLKDCGVLEYYQPGKQLVPSVGRSKAASWLCSVVDSYRVKGNCPAVS